MSYKAIVRSLYSPKRESDPELRSARRRISMATSLLFSDPSLPEAHLDNIDARKRLLRAARDRVLADQCGRYSVRAKTKALALDEERIDVLAERWWRVLCFTEAIPLPLPVPPGGADVANARVVRGVAYWGGAEQGWVVQRRG
jgi:hypothetical protein